MHTSKYIPKYNYQTLKREQTVVGRRYLTPDGNKLPSVTTILEATKSKESRDAIFEWQRRIGVEKARQITTEAANRGTRMHTYLERYIKEGEIPNKGGNPFGWASWNMADIVIREGLKNVSEYWGVEVPVYHPEIYAGTTDCVGIHSGEESILDFKQSNKPKKREWIDDYFIQICAYAEAHNKVWNTSIRKGVILMCVKPELDEQMNMIVAPQYQEFVLEGEEFERYRNLWWQKVEEYYSKHHKEA